MEYIRKPGQQNDSYLKLGDKKKMFFVCLLTVCAFMMVCHGFMFLNMSYSHDSISSMLGQSAAFPASLGRFLYPVLEDIRGYIAAPWWIGCISMAAIAGALFFLCGTLQVKSLLSVVMIAGILTTNMTETAGIATYMPWVDSYAIALMFCMMAVWCCKTTKWLGCFIGCALIIMSLGLYQPYAITVVALAATDTVLSMVKGEKLKDVLIRLAKYAGMFIAAYLLYMLIAKAVLAAQNISFSSGNNSITAISLNGFANFSAVLNETWVYFCFFMTNALNPGRYSAGLTVALGILCLMQCVLLGWKNKTKVYMLAAGTLLAALMPFIVNVQRILCGDTAIYHTLMVYSVYFAYILMIALADNTYTDDTDKKASSKAGQKAAALLVTAERIIVPVLIIIVVFTNMRFANNVYTGKYLHEKQTLSQMTKIMARAEETEGFDAKTMPVLFIGSLPNNSTVGKESAAFYSIIGNSNTKTAITYDETYYNFLYYYLGYPAADRTAANYVAANCWDEILAMPVYPAAGCCRIIEGCMVIRLSE